MYTTLEKIKAHLNIDSDYTQDDEYLVTLASACESAVAKRLNIKSLGCLMTEQGYLPEDVSHAVLLMIGNFYANREPVAYGTAVKIPYTLDFLFDINKSYRSPF